MDHAIVNQLLPSLGEQVPGLLAAYEVPSSGDGYFFSRRFESTLLLLFDDDLPIHAARQAIMGLRVNLAQVLEAPPLVFTPGSLARHARLFPLFHHHLTTHARRLHGQDLPLTSAAKIHPVERLSFLIAEAVDASAALAPQKSPPDAGRRLRRLAQQLSGKESDDAAPPAQLFGRVQVYLRLFVDSLPIMAKHHVPLVKSAAERNLLAFYEDQQRLLVVIPPLSANLLQQIDWPALAHPMASHLTTLNVATTDQLFLAIQAERPLDYLLGCYRRLWGVDVLAGLTVSARAVFRHAARKPSSYLVDGALGAYLFAPGEEGVHRVIHDYQNRLLNMRLEHELLCRLLQAPGSEPPALPSRRDAPLTTRIDAIVAQFNWWCDQYLQEMDARASDQKLSPP